MPFILNTWKELLPTLPLFTWSQEKNAALPSKSCYGFCDVISTCNTIVMLCNTYAGHCDMEEQYNGYGDNTYMDTDILTIVGGAQVLHQQ